MAFSVKKYLLFSSIIAVFTETFFISFVIDWKLFYLIVIVNYAALVKLKALKLNIYFALFILGVLIHAIICYFIIKIPPNYFLSQILGISIIGTYFYSLVKLYPPEEIFKFYAKISLIIAIIGYPMFFLGVNFNVNNDMRFCSILTEPAHYAIIVIPSCYYYLKTKKYNYFLILFISLILSNSSLGYIGCGLMLLSLVSLKKIKKAIVILPLLLFTFYLLYHFNEKVSLRLDETIRSLAVLKTGKFEETTNISSYALISNLYVAKLNFLDHPFGSGIGSHFYMYKNKYTKEFRTPNYIKTNKLAFINANDGASLFIRLVSDFGVFGLLFIALVLYICYTVFMNSNLIISQAIAIYIILKLIRDGHYFPPEFFFFIWVFIASIKHKIKFK